MFLAQTNPVSAHDYTSSVAQKFSFLKGKLLQESILVQRHLPPLRNPAYQTKILILILEQHSFSNSPHHGGALIVLHANIYYKTSQLDYF